MSTTDEEWAEQIDRLALELNKEQMVSTELSIALTRLVAVYKAGYRRNSFVAVSAIDAVQIALAKAKKEAD